MKIEFSLQIFEKRQITNFMNIRLVGAELFLADGRTDEQTYRHDEANSGFSQFCESAQ